MLQHAVIVSPFTSNVNPFTPVASKLAYMSLADRIKTARKAAGFRTQVELAKAVGCKRETVTMWESGAVAKVGGEYLPKLSRALGRSDTWIQDGKEPPQSIRAAASMAPNNDQLKQSIDVLRYIVGALIVSLVENRPDEAAGVADSLRAEVPKDFLDRDLLSETLRTLDRAAANSKRNPRALRPR